MRGSRVGMVVSDAGRVIILMLMTMKMTRQKHGQRERACCIMAGFLAS